MIVGANSYKEDKNDSKLTGHGWQWMTFNSAH